MMPMGSYLENTTGFYPDITQVHFFGGGIIFCCHIVHAAFFPTKLSLFQ